MQLVQIPKRKKGEFRTIAVPTPEQKAILRFELDSLNDKATKLCAPNVHGFMIGRSPVTNAKEHLGYAYTLSFDLSDFFDTVTEMHLKGKMPQEQIDKVLIDGRAWQGLPTSPAVANIAAVSMDEAILKRIKDRPNLVYTRYADDLTFSFDDFRNAKFLKQAVPEIISRCGFKTNKSKTRLQDALYGRRTITGISVGVQDISVCRSVKRKLRAAKHQKEEYSARGLEEWSKLKAPSIRPREHKIDQRKLDRLCDIWKISKIVLKDCPVPQPDIILADDIIITSDIITKIGPSNFTTNWKSCLQHPKGGNHDTTVGWAYHSGTAVAQYISQSKRRPAGFERPQMKARSMIHTLVDGRKCFNRIYGESGEAINHLKHVLVANGYHQLDSIRGNIQFAGSIPKTHVKHRLYQENFTITETPTEYTLHTRL